jgi:hypothetical protein
MSNYFDKKTAFLEPVVTQYGSNMVMTNVTKQRKTKYVNIDTRFTDEYISDKVSDTYTVNLPERLNEVNNIKVSQIEIPMSFYNISSSLGNNFFLLKNLTDKTQIMVTIMEGNYSTSSALSFENLEGLSFNIDFKNNRFSFINKTSSLYEIDFTTDSLGNYDNSNLKSKVGWLLGFRYQKYTLQPNLEVYAESIINLNTIRYIYLVLDEFTNCFSNSFISIFTDSIMNKKILARIVINNSMFPFGSILCGNEYNAILTSDLRKYPGKVDMQRLSIQLVTENSVAINLNRLDFSFLLQIEHE